MKRHQPSLKTNSTLRQPFLLQINGQDEVNASFSPAPLLHTNFIIKVQLRRSVVGAAMTRRSKI